MEMNSRPYAVRASVHLTRIAFSIGLAVSCVLIAALASMLLASQNGGPLLMNIERVSDLRDVEINGAVAPVKPAKVAPAGYEIVAEEDIRWLTDEVRYFNNRPIRPVKKITMVVTAYSPDERSCGQWADGITASGYSVWTNGMKLVAADTSILALGSLVSIPGYDQENVVPVLDRGGAIKGNRLDVLYPTHDRARRWGVQELEVTVWDYADGAPNGFRTNHRRRQ